MSVLFIVVANAEAKRAIFLENAAQPRLSSFVLSVVVLVDNNIMTNVLAGLDRRHQSLMRFVLTVDTVHFNYSVADSESGSVGWSATIDPSNHLTNAVVINYNIKPVILFVCLHEPAVARFNVGFILLALPFAHFSNLFVEKLFGERGCDRHRLLPEVTVRLWVNQQKCDDIERRSNSINNVARFVRFDIDAVDFNDSVAHAQPGSVCQTTRLHFFDVLALAVVKIQQMEAKSFAWIRPLKFD